MSFGRRRVLLRSFMKGYNTRKEGSHLITQYILQVDDTTSLEYGTRCDSWDNVDTFTFKTSVRRTQLECRDGEFEGQEIEEYVFLLMTTISTTPLIYISIHIYMSLVYHLGVRTSDDEESNSRISSRIIYLMSNMTLVLFVFSLW